MPEKTKQHVGQKKLEKELEEKYAWTMKIPWGFTVMLVVMV